MDAHDKDTGRERQREEALAQRLAEAFDRLGPPAAGECPEADQIAAYHQRALSQEEDAQCENHFAACTRCRKILTVLAASADVSMTEQPLSEHEIARLGTLATAAQRPPAAKPQRPRAFPWRFPWLVPAFGVAAALAVWFIVRPPWHLAAPESSQVLVAQAPKTAAPTGGDVGNAAPAGNNVAEPLTERLNAPARDTASPAQPPAPAAERLDKLGAVDSAANQALKDEQAARAESSRAVGGIAGGFSAPAEREQSREAASASVPAPAPQPAAVAPSAAQGEIRALRQQAAPAAASAQLNIPLTAANMANSGFSVSFQSPSGAVSWRAGTGGRIERSLDRGRIWQIQVSPLRENWLAGSAVSDAVCWLVGANGAIARTLDGERWERIAPPTMASAATAAASGTQPDWVAVSATSAQTATLTARDQQRYTTQDGGRTWRKQ